MLYVTIANVVRQFLTLDIACNVTYRIDAIVKFIIRAAWVQLTQLESAVASHCQKKLQIDYKRIASVLTQYYQM